jgi:hypothetical protein
LGASQSFNESNMLAISVINAPMFTSLLIRKSCSSCLLLFVKFAKFFQFIS